MSFIQIRVKRDEHLIFESSVAQFSRAVLEVRQFWVKYAEDHEVTPFPTHAHNIDVLEHILAQSAFSLEFFNRN